MRLFIAEKPSLARAIADALSAPQVRSRTHIECGKGDVVAWCAGHILESAPPQAYGEAYKTWSLADLPIAPKDWKLEVSAPELLRTIERLLKTASRVVHAGDPDREGQLLVDEVLVFLGYQGPVDRLLIRDLSPEAVRKELGALEPNTKYRLLYQAALARQRADWLYGMNMTRLYTLLGRAAGYQGVLSVGRVQTPLLGLIVARDRAIDQFRSTPYYLVAAEIQTVGGQTLRAFWEPSADAVDAAGRVVRREVAEAARQRLAGTEGRVHVSSEEKKTEPPPLPYALADLQIDAGKRMSMSAQAVLDACQSLYETHRLLTYPRSDCAHLPEGHHAQAKEVLAAIAAQAPSLAPAVHGADLTLRSKAWNDKRVTAHHAIVPTPRARSQVPLSDAERAVYELVARRYLAQFYPPHEYLETKIELEVSGERLATGGRRTLSPGWRALSTPTATGGEEAQDNENEHEKDRVSSTPLPHLPVGQGVAVASASVSEKLTQPPKAFTDASLIAAMCAVGKYVTDPNAKKILTEADGIGTPATRAAIIETLFERGYVRRDKKAIVSTPTGRALIASLPQIATTPDMTAVWEAAVRAIQNGTQNLDSFLGRVGAQLEELVAQGRALGRITVASSQPPPPPCRAARPARLKPEAAPSGGRRRKARAWGRR
ncbi:MAG TPA: DNA topoisomerase III [Polyangiaceae bacterium]|jgi:DNA topoisomerase-3|nr:DNA topoisomerase III [Polyangiaceae bacterium]